MILDAEIHEIIRGFFEAKVVQISTNPMFKLSSGKESPVYIDHRKIFSHVALRKRVITKWTEMLKSEFSGLFNSSNIVFAGTATAGIVPAYALAESFHAGFVYVRSKPKQHGLTSVIEGALPTNSFVFVVDDMITTGRSILQAIDNIKTEPVKSIVAISITNHNLKKQKEIFNEKNIVCRSLFNSTDIFDIAYAKNYINSREMKMIMEWLTQLDE